MKAMHNFIIQTDKPIQDTMTTSGGVKLYLDSMYNKYRKANTIFDIFETPVLLETKIKKGYQVMIDPQIFMHQHYTTGKGESPFLIDAEKGLWKLPEEMIILYRETPESDWKAYGQHNVITFEQTTKQTDSGITTEIRERNDKDSARLVLINETMADQAEIGDTVSIYESRDRVRREVPFDLNGVRHYWIRNKDILAVLNKN